MPETVRQCPLCLSIQNKPFDRRNFHGMQVENRICRDCGLVYQSPRMTEQEMAIYYQAEYRRSYQGIEGPIVRDLSVQTARAESLLGSIEPYIASIESYLDIGCSAGIALQHVNEHYDCEAVGIEPGDAYRTYARNLGMTIYSSLGEMEKLGEKRFNLISMLHVLEHLPDPVGYLRHLRESLIDPTGWLLVEVPNLYAHESFEKAHLVAYSPHTLNQTLEKAGFNIVYMETHGRPRSDLLPLYITAIAQPVFDAIHIWHPVPERWVALKRQMGLFRRRTLERLVPRQAWKVL